MGRSFNFTAEEHIARAMLLGRRYARNLHAYLLNGPEYTNGVFNPGYRLDADTLKPLPPMDSSPMVHARLQLVHSGRIGAKGSQFHKARQDMLKEKEARRRCQPS